MIDIGELITPHGVVANLRVGNKKQLLQELARRAAPLSGMPERTILDSLTERERRELQQLLDSEDA